MANYYGFTGDVTQKSDVDVFVPELDLWRFHR
jgi:predicted nucleotidyltransferase